MKFTGAKDTDRKILNKLNDKDLLSICSTNKSWRKFCNTDQTLWMNRIYNKFSYLSSDIINQYRKNYNNWSEYYIDIRRINKKNWGSYLMKAARDGRLDLVMIALNIHNKKTKGYEIILKTLDDVIEINQKNFALYFAVKNGHLDIVKYFLEQGSANEHDVLFDAARMGDLDIIRYLVEKGVDIHI